jgi:hypothetical protein
VGRLGGLGELNVRVDDRLRRIAGRLEGGVIWNEVMEKIKLVESHVAIQSEWPVSIEYIPCNILTS